MEFLPMRCGTPVYFSEGLTKLPNELRTLKPTFLLAPLRGFGSVCTPASAPRSKKRPAIVRRLFYTALGLGLKASRLRQQGKPIPAWIASIALDLAGQTCLPNRSESVSVAD